MISIKVVTRCDEVMGLQEKQWKVHRIALKNKEKEK